MWTKDSGQKKNFQFKFKPYLHKELIESWELYLNLCSYKLMLNHLWYLNLCSNTFYSVKSIKKLLRSRKQPLADVLQNRCSYKFGNTHSKTPVLSLFIIKKRLKHRCFPVNIKKFLRTAFLWNTSGGFSSKMIQEYKIGAIK